MGPLYRVVKKVTGIAIADLIIDSSDAILLSNDYELISTEALAKTLDELKEFYIEEINRKASQVRSRFITLYHGQESTYIRKAMQAAAYLQAVAPLDTDPAYVYVNLEYEAIKGAVGAPATMADLATVILQKNATVDQYNAPIEAQRQRGIINVHNAIDASSAKLERDGAIAALDIHDGVI